MLNDVNITRRSLVAALTLGAMTLAGCAYGATTDVTDIQNMVGQKPDEGVLVYSGYVLERDGGTRAVMDADGNLVDIPDDAVIEAVGIKSDDAFFVYRYAPDGNVTEHERPRDDEPYAYAFDKSATLTVDDDGAVVRFPDFASY